MNDKWWKKIENEIVFKASLMMMMRWWQANNNKNNININVILEFISTTEIEIVVVANVTTNQQRDYRRFEGTKTKPKYIFI